MAEKMPEKAPAQVSSPEELLKKLEEKEREAAQNWDQLLRAKAELENSRKRFEKAMSESAAYGQASVLERFLPIWDQWNHGMELLNGSGADSKVKEGFSMVTKNFKQLLESCGLAQVEALQGKPYDPQVHEVVRMEEAEGEEGLILSVVQQGFTLGGRLLRPAKVIVSKQK